MTEIERLTAEERATLVSAADRPFMSAYAQATKALRIIDAQAKRIAELDADVSAAHHAHANAVNAKQQRIVELESQLVTRDSRITEACVILATPGTWSDFAARARKVLTGG